MSVSNRFLLRPTLFEKLFVVILRTGLWLLRFFIKCIIVKAKKRFGIHHGWAQRCLNAPLICGCIRKFYMRQNLMLLLNAELRWVAVLHIWLRCVISWVLAGLLQLTLKIYLG